MKDLPEDDLTGRGGAQPFDAHSAASVSERLDRVYERCLSEGRTPSRAYRPFGFRFDSVNDLEADPEQWHWVRRIHLEYAESGSVLELRDRLERSGMRLSSALLLRILQNEVYVTGDLRLTYKGQAYALRQIALGGRAIPRRVFERNRVLLSSRLRAGPTSHAPGCLTRRMKELTRLLRLSRYAGR